MRRRRPSESPAQNLLVPPLLPPLGVPLQPPLSVLICPPHMHVILTLLQTHFRFFFSFCFLNESFCQTSCPSCPLFFLTFFFSCFTLLFHVAKLACIKTRVYLKTANPMPRVCVFMNNILPMLYFWSKSKEFAVMEKCKGMCFRKN